MLKISANAADAPAADRLIAELSGLGKIVEPVSGQLNAGDLLIAVLSAETMQQPGVRDHIIAALDRGLQIVLVTTAAFKLPRMIDHLPVVELHDGGSAETLSAIIDQQLSEGAHLPLRVITPSVQRANRRTGLLIGLLSLIVFLIGLYAVGVLHIQAPLREFNTIETIVALTIDPLIAPRLATYAQYLPADAESAAGFEATARAIPTQYRILVELTATQYAVNGYSFDAPDQAAPVDDVPAVITLTPSPTPAG
jgi:hypothetical protein